MAGSLAKYARARWQDRGERGDTLIEVLVTVVIVGLAAAAILGALLLSISSSTEHRDLATDDTLAKSALEAVKQQVELPQSSTNDFVDCSGSTTTNPPTGTPQTILGYWTSAGTYQLALPTSAGYSVNVTGVECFSTSLGTFDSTCSYSSVNTTNNAMSTCGSDTNGLLRVTVTVKDPTKYTLSLSTIVRNPTYESTYDSVY